MRFNLSARPLCSVPVWRHRELPGLDQPAGLLDPQLDEVLVRGHAHRQLKTFFEVVLTHLHDARHLSGGRMRSPSSGAKTWKVTEKRMQSIRAFMRHCFNLPGDPISFQAGQGYQALFTTQPYRVRIHRQSCRSSRRRARPSRCSSRASR